MLNKEKFFAYFLALGCVFGVLFFHIVPALIAGFLGFILNKNLTLKIKEKFPKIKLDEKLTGIVIGILSFLIFALITFGLIKILSGEDITELVTTISETLNNSRHLFPKEIVSNIPESIFELKKLLVENIKNNLSSIAIVSKTVLNLLLQITVGWLIGILASCHNKKDNLPIFAETWYLIWKNLLEAFRFVVFAQVKVASFNSLIIAIFLFIVCPILDWNIPYPKTLVILTFVCGLLPIIGNLISNSISFLLALTTSLPAALTVLGLLMLIHKGEYLIISKSLGSNIDSGIWELLIVLFAGEILFGFGGMVFAPILYAYCKKELKLINWIKK